MYVTGLYKKDGCVHLSRQALSKSGRVTATVCCHHAANSKSLPLQVWRTGIGVPCTL